MIIVLIDLRNNLKERNLKMNDRILELQKEIDAEKEKIKKCKHDFGEPYYDPDTELVGYGSVQDGAGSDPHWSYEGYEKREKPRWARKCKICGNIEYTYEQKPIIKGFEPKF